MLVGLTGNIGSGKTLVSMIFNRLSIPVYNADESALRFYDDEQISDQIYQLFPDSFNANMVLDRSRLASIVFNDPDKLAQLSSIIHPLVMKDIESWHKLNDSSPYCLVESAILLEHNLDSHFCYIIVVSAPESLRIERVMARDGINAEAVRQRIRHQWDEDRKSAAAGFLILNDGEHPLIPAVLGVHNKLLQIASAAKY